MSPRIKQLVADLVTHHIDGFVVTKDVDIRYLTGFPAEESWLMVGRRGAFYITDFRYTLQAKKGLRGVTVKEYRTSKAQCLFETARQQRIRVLAFDDRHISHHTYCDLRHALPRGMRLPAVRGFVDRIRACKDKEELRQIKKAIAVNLDMFTYLKRVVRPGIREKEILEKMQAFAKKRDVGFSFPPIVASGPNSCFPHARVTDRRVRKTDIVLIDAGIDVEGYKSDLTRMFFLGKIPQHFWEVYRAVDDAQKAAIRTIRAGIPARDVDQQARNVLKNHKLDQYFGHALGHGVGLEIHEPPALSSKNPSVLHEGMVITVEPAVYIPHRFGIRIEDMVLVTPRGFKLLSRHDL